MSNLFKYGIRELVLEDLSVALQLVRNVFMKFEAPDYSDEGIKTFIDFIEIDSISKMFKEDILKFGGGVLITIKSLELLLSETKAIFVCCL